MNKKDFIKKTARACDMSEARTREVISAFTEIVSQELREGGTVKLDGFGKFYTTDYKGRQVKSPQGNLIQIKDRKSPRFKPSSKLKQQIIQ